jgi:chromosome partitioning protein
MPIFSLLSLKGGVGKTTTTMHLAGCAQKEGRRVTVIDADEEQSALRWASFTDLPFNVVLAERDRLAQQARSHDMKGETVFIDTPPNNREILTRTAMVSNHVIVPLIPTGLDIDRMMPTLELLKDAEASRGALDVAILLNRWDSRKRLAQEALEALADYPILEAKVRNLTRYEQAFGATPSDFEEFDAVWREIAHV